MEDSCQLLVFSKECFLDNTFLERHMRQLKNIINLGYQKVKNKYKIIGTERIGDQEDFLEEMGVTDETQHFLFFLLVGSKSIIERVKQDNYTRSSRASDVTSFDIPAQYVDHLHQSVDAKVDSKLVDKDSIVSEDDQDRVLGTAAIRTPPPGNEDKSGAFIIQLTAVTSFFRGGGQKIFNLMLKYILENDISPLFKKKLKIAGYKCVKVEADYIFEHELLNFYRKCGFSISSSKLMKTDSRGKILDPGFAHRITANRDFHLVYTHMIIDL